MLKRFWQSTSGNFAMMFASMLPVLLAAVGFALDVATLMKARSDLQNALDSAVLAASRLSDQTGTRNDTFNAFFATVARSCRETSPNTSNGAARWKAVIPSKA